MDSVIDCICSAFNKVDEKRKQYENLYAATKNLIAELKECNDTLSIECSQLRYERDMLTKDIDRINSELRYHKSINDNLRAIIANKSKTKKET